MTNIYEQHDKTFQHVAAYIITDASGIVAKAAFKYATSGLRTTCFFHVLGTPMVKAFASGGGYDKASAAAAKAARKVMQPTEPRDTWSVSTELLSKICDAIKDEGRHWDDDLRAAGFTVMQAV